MELTLDKFIQLLCYDNLTEKIGIMGGRESDAIQENRCLLLKFLHENSVEYVYNPMYNEGVSPYTTKYVLKRREWPAPEAIAKDKETK